MIILFSIKYIPVVKPELWLSPIFLTTSSKRSATFLSVTKSLKIKATEMKIGKSEI